MELDKRPIIFLDIDGVLNCEVHFARRLFLKEIYKPSDDKSGEQKIEDRMEYYSDQICKERLGWLNELCEELNAVIVISSTWRKGRTVQELQEIMNYCGGTIEIIDKTGFNGYERGTEISKWLKDNISLEKHGVHYYDFYNYVIIDDDSDMLLSQANHFFQTDNYFGLTPTVCYKIKRFLTGKTY